MIRESLEKSFCKGRWEREGAPGRDKGERMVLHHEESGVSMMQKGQSRLCRGHRGSVAEKQVREVSRSQIRHSFTGCTGCGMGF